MPRQPYELGDAPIESQYRETMNGVAKAIDEIFNGDKKPKKVGFILMIFPFEGFDGRCNYISNANRNDVVTLLKEQLARFEGQPELQGKA